MSKKRSDGEPAAEGTPGLPPAERDCPPEYDGDAELGYREPSLAGRNAAFELAMKGASLEESLGLLVSTAIAQVEGANHCAFYLANAEGTELRHVVGMPDSYFRDTRGFKLCPELSGCGLSNGATSEVITPNVREAPGWQSCLWLADKYGFRGCWSFPIESDNGTRLGAFVLYFGNPHAPTPAELEFARSISATASVIIGHHQSWSHLQAGAERQAFLLKLSDHIKPLAEPAAILGEACRLLGEHLGADRAYYVEVDHARDKAIIDSDYASAGVASLAGELPLSAFRWVTPLYGRGEPVVVDDVSVSDLVPEADRAAMLAVQIVAWIAIPLVKAGEFVGALCVAQAQPREWNAGEVALVAETAERLWSSIDRARAEKALRNNEERSRRQAAQLQAVLESLNDALYIGSEAGISLANQAALDQLGYATREELNRNIATLSEEIENRDAETGARLASQDIPFARALRGEQVVREVLVRHRRSGEDRFVRCAASPVTVNGRVIAAVAINTDITEQRRARVLLRESEQRQTFLLKFSDALRAKEGVEAVGNLAVRMIADELVLDRVYLVTANSVDDKVAVTHETRREGMPPMLGTYHSSDFPSAIKEFLERTIVYADVRTDPRLTELDRLSFGSLGAVAFAAVPIRRGSDALIWGAGALSTKPRQWTAGEIALLEEAAERTWAAVERARTEAALRSKEEEFRVLADNIDQLAWICDETLGNVTWYNQRWLDFTGLDFEQMKGWDWSKVQHPDHVARVVAGVKQSSESGEPWDDTFPLRGKDGDYRWFLSRAVPIRNADGRIAHWFGTNTDVTELREIEAALREREAQLQVAARAKDEFLAMLGHELRNPLSPIVTTLELMKLRAPNTLVQERRVIEKQVQHLTGLVDDLLDVARIVRSTLEITSVPVTIDEVVAAAVETSQPLFEERNQTLHVTVEHGLMVKGDSRRLVQVLVNLLTNAAKYSPRNGEAELKAAAEDGEVVLQVRDEGQGIDPGLLETVFEAFTQEPQALDRSRGGLGLGLAIVRNLVRLHRGSVTAWSEGRNRGSEFTVRLPLLARDEAPHANTVPAEDRTDPAAGAKRLKVLVVDDYELAAESLAALLQALGFDTCVAHDGAEALRMIEQIRPDAALIDIGLPVMDGYEVARTVRRTPGSERLPLIALTGYGQDSDRARAIKAGFNEHVAKPVNARRVEQLIKQLVKAE